MRFYHLLLLVARGGRLPGHVVARKIDSAVELLRSAIGPVAADRFGRAFERILRVIIIGKPGQLPVVGHPDRLAIDIALGRELTRRCRSRSCRRDRESPGAANSLDPGFQGILRMIVVSQSLQHPVVDLALREVDASVADVRIDLGVRIGPSILDDRVIDLRLREMNRPVGEMTVEDDTGVPRTGLSDRSRAARRSAARRRPAL